MKTFPGEGHAAEFHQGDAFLPAPASAVNPAGLIASTPAADEPMTRPRITFDPPFCRQRGSHDPIFTDAEENLRRCHWAACLRTVFEVHDELAESIIPRLVAGQPRGRGWSRISPCTRARSVVSELEQAPPGPPVDVLPTDKVAEVLPHLAGAAALVQSDRHRVEGFVLRRWLRKMRRPGHCPLQLDSLTGPDNCQQTGPRRLRAAELCRRGRAGSIAGQVPVRRAGRISIELRALQVM